LSMSSECSGCKLCLQATRLGLTSKLSATILSHITQNSITNNLL
jgi:hypothetical protein